MKFTSYTILPEEFYIERSADKQIVSIIDNMQRPGYVLVSRQMGKTNLLLHTKKKLESERCVFVYLDFSSIRITDDRAFFELLIDKAIEERPELFKESKSIIKTYREEHIISAVNRYTAEVIELLNHVDKLVFVLDEIDALARNKYSNSIFSQIRSDYFQRVNYKELEKLTYVLSGVIEPKDLIKDPNISPFNIGEKIFLRSFSKEQSYELISKAGLNLEEDVLERIYYWTEGHPRMLNDICNEMQFVSAPTIDDVDTIINSLYLESFDRAPVDHIRDIISKDSFLRNAYIQLFYNADLSVELKQKLFLAGIADYQGLNLKIKNPIIKAALSIEWIQSINNKARDFLVEMESLIFLRKSYNEAIKQINRYVELECRALDDFNRAYYLLGVCFFRTYRTEESQKYLNKIEVKEGTKADIILNAYLIKGYNYSNMRETTSSIRCFDYIISSKPTDWELYAKACIGKVDALIQRGGQYLNDARKSLGIFMQDSELQYNYNYKAVCYYELSALEDACGNERKALESIEQAIQYADNNEMPTLLYYKLMLCKDIELQNDTIETIISYLSGYDKKPEIEDFDKMLSLNYSFLSCILSEIILNHPSYIRYIDTFLKWFNESKEAAYNSIVKYLRDYDPEKALPFANHILKLSNSSDWNFGSDHVFNALLIRYKYDSNIKNAYELYEYIEQNKYFDNRQEVVDALLKVVRDLIETKKINEAKKIVSFFKENLSGTEEDYIYYSSVIMSYYNAILGLENRDFRLAQQSAKDFFDFAEEAQKHDFSAISPKYVDFFNKLIKNIKEGLSRLQNNIPAIINELDFGKIGRNEKVEVIYGNSNVVVTEKYKKLEDDINAGLCRIVRIIK